MPLKSHNCSCQHLHELHVTKLHPCADLDQPLSWILLLGKVDYWTFSSISFVSLTVAVILKHENNQSMNKLNVNEENTNIIQYFNDPAVSFLEKNTLFII